MPPACMTWLHGIGCSTAGLAIGPDRPTPRAWQLFEEDGRRTQVWRVPECDELYQQLRPSFAELPQQFQQAVNYHLGIHASHPPMKLLRALRSAAHQQGGVLSVEPYTSCDSPPPAEQLSALLQLTDIFSPNEAEAASIVGPGSPEQLVQRLLDAGAAVVTLRQGPHGVLVGERDTGKMWQVPAVPGTLVVDVTGCGNAFCGGLLAARHAGRDLQDSARWGCVAGSIMAEWQGVPPADLQQLKETAAAKYQLLLASERRAGVHPTDVVAAAGTSSSTSSSTATSCVRPRHDGHLLQRQLGRRFGLGSSKPVVGRRMNNGLKASNSYAKPKCLLF